MFCTPCRTTTASIVPRARSENTLEKETMRLVVGVLVLMLSGCAAVGGGTAPPSADVSGQWVGTWSLHSPTKGYPQAGYGDISMTLKQSGAEVTGNLIATGDLMVPGSATALPTNFEGTVRGSSIILRSPESSGLLDVRGEEMTGVIGAIMPANVSLRRRR
jgi:hypothetical protein